MTVVLHVPEDFTGTILLAADTAHLCAWSGNVDGVWTDRHPAEMFTPDRNGVQVFVCTAHIKDL